jgi:pimeloyl-ACP methyl ester carboxylesterase
MIDRQIRLHDGRQLAYAEYGDLNGKPVLLIQGTPSTRLMHPDESTTYELGVRLIMFDRPGFGLSDYQPNRLLMDYPNDLAELADALGITRFAVAGISGGGPYTAATAYALSDRVTAAAFISAAGPADAPHALDGITPVRRIGYWLARYAPALVQPMLWLTNNPQRDPQQFFARYTVHNPPADQAILARPEIRAMMIANYAEATRQGLRGFARELWIVARPWGFPLRDIGVPVHIWHGEADNSTPISMARYIASMIPDCRATYLPRAGHMFLFEPERWREMLGALVNEGGRIQ